MHESDGCKAHRGFTFAEVVAVVAILLILTAILLPVFTRVKAKAIETKCASNLHQIFLALSMYRNDWDGTDTAAPSSQMGFPAAAYWALVGRSVLDHGRLVEWWRCDGQPTQPKANPVYWQMWPPPEGAPWGHSDELDKDWIRHVGKMGDQAIIMQDPNHQSSGVVSAFTRNRCLGLHLGGSIKLRVKRGRFDKYSFWED